MAAIAFLSTIIMSGCGCGSDSAHVPTTPPDTDDDELIDFFFSRAAVILPQCTRRPDRGCNHGRIEFSCLFRLDGNKVLMLLLAWG